jgi:hypothetical protein
VALTPNSSLTPDLNLPAVDTSALVPMGLVSDRVNQLDKTDAEVGMNASVDLAKKQERSKSQTNARSAAAVSSSPCRTQRNS